MQRRLHRLKQRNSHILFKETNITETNIRNITSSEHFLDPDETQIGKAPLQSGMTRLCTPDLPNSASALVFYPCPYHCHRCWKCTLMLLVFTFLPLSPISLSVLLSQAAGMVVKPLFCLSQTTGQLWNVVHPAQKEQSAFSTQNHQYQGTQGVPQLHSTAQDCAAREQAHEQ